MATCEKCGSLFADADSQEWRWCSECRAEVIEVSNINRIPDKAEESVHKSTNGYSTILKVIGIVIMCLGIAAGIYINSFTSNYYLLLTYSALGLISGALFMGLGEIIILLQNILSALSEKSTK